MSFRAALAAVVVYFVAASTLAMPIGGRWWPLALVGVVLVVLALRSGRAVLLGLGLMLPVVAWTVRAVQAHAGSAGRAGSGVRTGSGLHAGSGLAALLLGVALTAVVVLARVALDAAPRRGPVRIDPALRRHLARDGVVVAASGLAIGAAVLVVADPAGRRTPPALLLPLGLLAVPVLLGGVVAVVGKVQGAASSAAARPYGRWLGVVVLVAVVALPLLAGLGARAPLPPSHGQGGGPPAATDQPIISNPATTTPDDRPPPGAVAAPGAMSRFGVLIAAGVIGLVATILLGRGERMISADDRRPDRSPPEEVLHGAPPAPTVEALAPEHVAEVLDEALLQLRDELDPRLAVRCAYASVATGLGRSELARRPSETELEFLDRQLGLVGASEPALRRLTDLFELARFSNHPVDEAMRADAAAALVTLRQTLPHTADRRKVRP